MGNGTAQTAPASPCKGQRRHDRAACMISLDAVLEVTDLSRVLLRAMYTCVDGLAGVSPEAKVLVMQMEQ